VRGRLTVAVALLALIVVSAAAAENYQYEIVAADKALATKVVLKRADLGGLKGWAGGAVKPDRSAEGAEDRCANGYLPKESDLVVTGDAESKYTYRDVTIDTQINVFRSAAMVTTDWQRNAGYQGLLACMRTGLADGLPKGERLVSVTRLAFPHVGSKTFAVRVVVDVTGSGRTVPMTMDFVGFYRGRAEAMLVISGLTPEAAEREIIKAIDLRVAAAVVAKMPAA